MPRKRTSAKKPVSAATERTYNMEELAAALVAAHEYRNSSNQPLRDFYAKQASVLSKAFGVEPGSDPGNHRRRHLRDLVKATVKQLGTAVSPFAGMMEAPQYIVELYQRFGGRIGQAERQLKSELRALLLTLLEALATPGKTIVTETELRALGFDSSTRPADPERSFTLDTNSNGNTVDEYVWLGDVPIVMLRSLFDANMVRQTDWGSQTTVCQRRGELGRCGSYFFVTDHLNRPSMVLDKNFVLTGVGEYDSFGELNRVYQRAETAHPYLANTNAAMATNVGRDKFAYALPLRARFSFVDTSTSYKCGKNLWCPDDDRGEVREGSTVKATVLGYHFGKVLTPYFETANGRFDVWFLSNASYQRDGLVFEGYDYQRVGVGGYRVFPPLRFPGQYFDEETGLHENWNRYYDPSVGRYISPEPLLSSPKYVAGMVHSGSPPSTYAYALGNPTGVTERDGRVVIPITVELPNGKHSTCSESVKKLIAKMMRSVETSKNCRCKRLFEDKDASQGGTSLADKLLSEELVYSLAC